MEVILVEDVDNLGQIGQLVSVKPGYARNYLLPKGMAMVASTKNAKVLAHQKRLADYKAAKAHEADQATLGKLTGTSVTIARKVGEQDKLFGSVTSIDIEDALNAEGLKVRRKQIELTEPIKTLGVYEVPVKLRADLVGTVKVWVVAEDAE